MINSGEVDAKKKIRKDYVLAAYESLKEVKEENKYGNNEKNRSNEQPLVLGDINNYRIDVDKFTYPKIIENKTSKKYQYDIYENGKLIKTIVLYKNNHNLLPFPESGIN